MDITIEQAVAILSPHFLDLKIEKYHTKAEIFRWVVGFHIRITDENGDNAITYGIGKKDLEDYGHNYHI